MMRAPSREEREAQATAEAETMLALAPHIGVDPETLAFLAHRFTTIGSQLDAAEPARRADLVARMTRDFDELAEAYKRMEKVVERGGEA